MGTDPTKPLKTLRHLGSVPIFVHERRFPTVVRDVPDAWKDYADAPHRIVHDDVRERAVADCAIVRPSDADAMLACIEIRRGRLDDGHKADYGRQACGFWRWIPSLGFFRSHFDHPFWR